MVCCMVDLSTKIKASHGVLEWAYMFIPIRYHFTKYLNAPIFHSLLCFTSFLIPLVMI